MAIRDSTICLVGRNLQRPFVLTTRPLMIGEDSSSLLGMLDFAAAVQVEAIKGNWRIMIR